MILLALYNKFKVKNKEIIRIKCPNCGEYIDSKLLVIKEGELQCKKCLGQI